LIHAKFDTYICSSSDLAKGLVIYQSPHNYNNSATKRKLLHEGRTSFVSVILPYAPNYSPSSHHQNASQFTFIRFFMFTESAKLKE